MKWRNLIFLVMLSMFTVLSCKDKEREVEEIEPEEQAEAFEEDLEEVRRDDGIVVQVEGNPELSTFATGLNAWNIEEELNDEQGPFTIFAPDNNAYSTLYRDQGQEVLQANNDAIVQYHIVKGEMTAEQLRQEVQNANGAYKLNTLADAELTVKLEGDKLVLEGATGDKANITSSSTSEQGVIHIIDKVLLPADLEVEITAEK